MTNNVPLKFAHQLRTATIGIIGKGGTRTAWPVGLSFATADCLFFLVSALLAIQARSLLGGEITPRTYEMLLPAAAMVLACFAFSGLYPGIALNSVVELNLVAKSCTIACLVLIAAAFFGHESLAYSRGVIVFTWIFSVILISLGRRWTRSILSRYSWWGVRAVLIDPGQKGMLLVKSFEDYRRCGIHVVASVSSPRVFDPVHRGLGSWGKLRDVQDPKRSEAARSERFAYAILRLSGMSSEDGAAILDECSGRFRHTLLVADLPGLSNYSASVKELGGSLCVELPHNLLSPAAQSLKRVFDIVVSTILMVVLSPLLLLICAAIAITSKGPVFYSHVRIGHGGRTFRVWKFRTMMENADLLLREYLERHPHLEEEWNQDHKLRCDPRNTPVGRFLRKLSLDELPQLWNIFLGEMSFVGPRPITSKEVHRYGQQFELYLRVLPGLTGLWQISGRNNTTYEQRVAFDEFYVRNWSIWMDLHILINTAKTVLTADGAY